MTYSNLKELIDRINSVFEFSDREEIAVNDKGFFGNTPLAIVMTWNDLDAARMLLENGALVNEVVELGDTALHRAVSMGTIEMVRLLLEHGARVDIINKDGDSPLGIAERRKKHDIAALLKERESLSQ